MAATVLQPDQASASVNFLSLLLRAIVATTVNRSAWREFVSKPKNLASQQPTAVEAIRLQWYSWHVLGIASNLYVLEPMKRPYKNITKERYIKAFDPAVAEVMERLQATMEFLAQSPAGALGDSC